MSRELLIQHYEAVRLSALNTAVLHRRLSAKAEAEQQARLAQLRLDVLKSNPEIQTLDQPINMYAAAPHQ
jgi:hypothetical protein